MTSTEQAQRRCATCREHRDPSEFVGTGSRASCASCRERTRQLDQSAMAGSVSRTRARHLWKAYRVLPEEYDRLREQQGYRCAICRTHEDAIPVLRTGRPRLDGKPAARPFPLVVDHCHDSDRVRGLLCQNCNIAIGCAKDSTETLRAAIAYLEAGGDASRPGS